MGLLSSIFGGAPKAAAKPEALAVDEEPGVVLVPVSGTVEETESIADPVFSSEMMGKTVAVRPTNGVLFAPVSGVIASAMPHAVGIASDHGVEVLMHVGIDTVNMQGEGFSVYVKQGDHVSAGEPLLSFDRNKIKAAGYDDVVMTIVTNSDDYPKLAKVASGVVEAGAPAMTCA